MTSDRSVTPTSARWKWILVVLVALIMVGTAAEWGTRAYLRARKGYDGQHLYQFAFDPYKNILPTPHYVDTRGVQHNSVGFRRSSEVSIEKPVGTYRIFLMGASTAYGLGGLWAHIDPGYPVLKNSETIDAYLEQELIARLPGRKIEVINAAITSSWTHHNLIYLNQSILRYQPDMVLFLDGFNDFYFYDKGHDQFASYTYSLPSRVIMGEPTMGNLAYANGWWLFRKSAFVHMLARGATNVKRMLAGKPARNPIDVEAAAAGQRRDFMANAFKMEERSGLILQHEGVIPVFMLQPMLVLERHRTQMPEVERRLFEFNVESYLPNYEAYVTEAAGFVHRQMQEMAPQVGGQFIDLTTAFAGAEGQMFTDYAHLTPEANQILARIVADSILPLIEPQRLPGAPQL